MVIQEARRRRNSGSDYQFPFFLDALNDSVRLDGGKRGIGSLTPNFSSSWLLGFDITMRGLTRTDTCRKKAAYQLGQLHDRAGTHVCCCDNEEHNFRIEDHHADQHCRAEEREAWTVLLCIEFLEAEVTNAADHEE